MTMMACRRLPSRHPTARRLVQQHCRHLSSSSSSFLSHIQNLPKLFPHWDLTTNPYELEQHGHGESHHRSLRLPDMVVQPKTVNDVQDLIKYCVQYRIPVVPFGAGTSVEGHVNALHGGISLDMKQHFSHIMWNEQDAHATVGPGVTRMQLNDALRHSGLYFTVDPGADATLGGMVATGASGTSTVKYGGMRENLLELECVIADEDASVVHCGTKALKNSAGYDLLSLFCGSEGTLGVITSVTVKLHPIPDYVVAAKCQFNTLHHAAEAVVVLKLQSHGLTRCEVLDSLSVQAFNAYNPQQTHMAVKPTLFLEFIGHSESSLQEIVEATESICTELGGSSFDFASALQDRKALWAARHSLYYASIASRPGATGAIVTDCCVPLSKFADLIDATAQDVAKHNIVGPCFGHAGDGNLHCILPIKQDDDVDYMERVHKVHANLIDRTLASGGTSTGEHGVGYGKMKYLERQYGPGAVAVMRAIKKAMDPYGIMNPGKVVDVL